MRGAAFLLVALVLALPPAAALSVQAGREGDAFVVILETDEPTGPLDVVVSHVEPGQGMHVDAVLPIELLAGERRVLEVRDLPERSYDVQVTRRGEHVVAPPTPVEPTPTAPADPPAYALTMPPLSTLAKDGVVEVTVSSPFPGAEGYRAALDMDGRVGYHVRAGARGEVLLARTNDDGRTWAAPETVAGAAPGDTPDFTYFETARFWDGTLALLYKQAPLMMPGAAGWTLARISEDGTRVLSTAALQLPAGRTITTDDQLELLAMPDGRLLLVGHTFARDPTVEEHHGPSALHVWRLNTEGQLQDEATIPLPHSVTPAVRGLLDAEGNIHLAWTYGLTAEPTTRVWTTRSVDGGETFWPPSPVDLPLAGGDWAAMRDAAVTNDGTLLLTVDSILEGSTFEMRSYLVRVPLDEPPSQVDMRTVKEYPGRPSPSMVRILADGDRIFLHAGYDSSTWMAESFDGGRSFDPAIEVRTFGMPFHVADMTLLTNGVPAFVVQGDACDACFGLLTDAVAREVPIGFSPWGPLDTIDVVPVPPPYPMDAPYEYDVPEPIMAPEQVPPFGTPGVGLAALLAAVAALALLRRRGLKR